MGRPVDTATVAARRRVLLARLGRGVVLVPAAHERELERDYVQGQRLPPEQHVLLFHRARDPGRVAPPGGWRRWRDRAVPTARDPLQERWTGLRLGPDTTAVRLTGIARVLPTDSLDPVLSAALVRARGPLYVPLDQTTRDEPRFRDLLFSGRDVRNLRPSADSMRLVKDADEVARMRKAVEISVLGHVTAMQAARPGVWEYEIEAALEAEFRRNGADRVGYPSIVGSGPTAPRSTTTSTGARRGTAT